MRPDPLTPRQGLVIFVRGFFFICGSRWRALDYTQGAAPYPDSGSATTCHVLVEHGIGLIQYSLG